MTQKITNSEKPTFLRSLLWKLTLTFVILTFATLLLLTLVSYLLGYYSLTSSYQNFWERDGVSRDAAKLASWLEAKPVNVPALTDWLDFYREQTKLRRRRDFAEIYGNLEKYLADEDSLYQFAVFDRNGDVLAATAAGKSFSVDEKVLVDKIILENADEAKLIDAENGRGVIFAAPIRNRQNQIIGGVLINEKLPFSSSQILLKAGNDFVLDWLTSTVALLIFSFLLGFPVARHATERLRRIGFVTESWSEGDFSARTDDDSADELGILARRLNEMANDLRENFALREAVIVADERNRIARDLHDSVKQQVFALAFQIGIAKAMLGKDSAAEARTHLDESEKLIEQIQRELMQLIGEMSSLDGQNKTFAERIETLCGDWSRRQQIRCEISVGENLAFTPVVEQTFYRIAQEALANIARHSRASQATIKIEGKSMEKLKLTIADNGCGFDVERAVKGFGLQNMLARVEQLPNGWLKIESKINEGTTIEAGFDLKTKNGALK